MYKFKINKIEVNGTTGKEIITPKKIIARKFLCRVSTLKKVRKIKLRQTGLESVTAFCCLFAG